MSLPDLIRKARLLAGLSQRDLAQLLSVHPSAVGAWEVGANQPDTLQKIGLSIELGIRFADLLPEVAGRAILITQPEQVALFRLIERLPLTERVGLLQIVAGYIEKREAEAPAPAPSARRTRRRRSVGAAIT